MNQNTVYNVDWEKHAEIYKSYFDDSDNRVSSVQVFPRILDYLGDISGKRVLDFGCGLGRFSRIFHDCGAKVTAYDISASEVEIAQSLDDDRNINYSHDEKVFEKDNSFDIILCFMTLLCNPQQQAAELVQKISHCLSTDGIACFVNTNTEMLGHKFKDFYSVPPERQEQGMPYKTIIPTSKGDIEVTDHYYLAKHLSDLFNSAQFEIQQEEIIAKQFILHILKK